jgi:hypothetical protein
MAKIKPAGGKKREAPAPTRGLIPCALLVLIAMGILSLLLFYSLKGTAPIK